MLDKIQRTINEYGLIKQGDKIVVAVSGGPDSVCLLHILHKLKDIYNIQLYGAHLNHNFRGVESQLDALYVASLCEELNIMCFIKSLDVSDYAKKEGLSMEEAGRTLRYVFLNEVAENVGASKIAVAHNRNDQAETVLMRLLRGSGIDGLSAIYHERGKVIRPLLDISREDIEAYCFENNLYPRIDKSNSEPIFFRNKIRLELIPYLQKNYNPNIIESLARTAELLKNDGEYIEEEARTIYKTIASAGEKCVQIPAEKLNELHYSIQSRIFRLTAEELVGRKEAFEYKHIQNILSLLKKNETGKKIILSMGIIVKLSYENVLFALKEQEIEEYLYELPQNDSIYIDEAEGWIRTRILNRTDVKELNRGKYIKYFDFDKVNSRMNIRNRRSGDRFWPLGMEGSKKLKDLYIDYKIDRTERNKIPLICDGDQIMWIVGYRISEKYKITNDTKKIIEIEIEKSALNS